MNYSRFILFLWTVFIAGCASARVEVKNFNPDKSVDVTVNGRVVASDLTSGYASAIIAPSPANNNLVDVNVVSYVWLEGVKSVIDFIRVVLRIEGDSEVNVQVDKNGLIDLRSDKIRTRR